MREYGREVQRMVEKAKLIADRDERQAYAEEIVALMSHVNPQLRKLPDFQAKMWNHLAYIANYELDIDYPVEIEKDMEVQRHDTVKYPDSHIKMRQYGSLVEKLLQKALDSEDAEREDIMTAAVQNMRQMLSAAKQASQSNERIAHDIEAITEGKMSFDEALEYAENAPIIKLKDNKRKKK